MTQLVRLGDLAEQVRGVTYAKSDAVRDPRPGFVPILRAGNIHDAGLLLDDLVYVPVDCVSAKQLVRRNDVLVATSSGSLDVVGKATRSAGDFDGAFGAFLKVLRPSEKVDPIYFAHYFRTPEYRRAVSMLAAGANINNLKNEHLSELLIPLPPLTEQRRLAAILDVADGLRVKCRQSVATLDDLIQSKYLDMFGRPMTTMSHRRALGEVCTVVTGNTPSRANPLNYGDGIEWIKSDNLGGLIATMAEERLTTIGQKAGRVVPPGSVLVTCIAGTPASIGRASLVDRKVAFNQQINAAIPGPIIDSRFLLEQLRVAPDLVRQQSTGGMKGLVSKSKFEAIEVHVPPLDRQQRFAAFAHRVDTIRSLQVAAKTEADSLFASLQNRAFSGQL